jgi:hypothetical protein
MVLISALAFQLGTQNVLEVYSRDESGSYRISLYQFLLHEVMGRELYMYTDIVSVCI